VDIELIVEVRPLGDWLYQWRVSFPSGARFAICSPYRDDFNKLGGYDASFKAKGCRTAMAILRDAEASGNYLLAAYTRSAGRISQRR
jgi:hypothetical protein